ncbi:MAG: 3-keto-disaccharide hydrolase, partial [Flavobacteriaceae bacterium]
PPDHDTGGIYESYGRGWLIKPEKAKDAYLKMGEWNKMKIICNDDTVTTFLNGHEMVTLTDEKIGKGKGGIALQIHDGGGIKVKWRNINLTEL